MSLRSVTQNIDSVISVAVLVFCFCIWGVLGFAHYIEVAVAAACMIVIVSAAAWWMKSR